jgi:diaminohydroxyphosphoribosylaminopyrimidine deaminase/5-amino-6-(5-phosphoribosylamino)uracil reductase
VSTDVSCDAEIDCDDLMKRALKLAEHGRGYTGVNPLVGAVVVDRSGRLVGSGYHARLGEAHAEVVALREAGDGARGGTLVVNLEPCCHTGRTGPCTSAILEAGIARVVIAHRDPDVRVSGRGVAALRAAGVEVQEGIGSETALLLNEHYLFFKVAGRPFVTLKLALSLDGFIADADDRSRWLTGPVCRSHAHALRAGHDAILVGARTAIADDPQLTVRHAPGPSPRRFVLVGGTPLPSHLRLLAGQSRATRVGADPSNADWVVGRDDEGSVDLRQVLRRMAADGVSSLLVEGGGVTAGHFVRHDLVNKYVFYYGPRLLGAGRPALSGFHAPLALSARLSIFSVEPLADGLVVTAYPPREGKENPCSPD